MISTTDDKRRVQAAGKLLKAAKQITSPPRRAPIWRMGVGQFPTLLQWGYSDEPGHWDHWPSAFVATWPNEGVVAGPGRHRRRRHDVSVQEAMCSPRSSSISTRERSPALRADLTRNICASISSCTRTLRPSACRMWAGACIPRRAGCAWTARQGAVAWYGCSLVPGQFPLLHGSKCGSRRLQPFAVPRRHSHGRLYHLPRRHPSDDRRRGGRGESATVGMRRPSAHMALNRSRGSSPPQVAPLTRQRTGMSDV